MASAQWCLADHPMPCWTCNSISGLCPLDAVPAPHLCLYLWAKPSVLGVGGRSPLVEVHWLEETPDAQAGWTSPCPSTASDPGASEGSIRANPEGVSCCPQDPDLDESPVLPLKGVCVCDMIMTGCAGDSDMFGKLFVSYLTSHSSVSPAMSELDSSLDFPRDGLATRRADSRRCTFAPALGLLQNISKVPCEIGGRCLGLSFHEG